MGSRIPRLQATTSSTSDPAWHRASRGPSWVVVKAGEIKGFENRLVQKTVGLSADYRTHRLPAGGASVSILLVDLITCDDDGHIIGSSSAEGQVHQASAGVLGVGVMLKNPGDRVVAHGLGQAVGAEEKGVAVEQ